MPHDIGVVFRHGAVIGEKEFQLPVTFRESRQFRRPAAEFVKLPAFWAGMFAVVPFAVQLLH